VSFIVLSNFSENPFLLNFGAEKLIFSYEVIIIIIIIIREKGTFKIEFK
jgi:hypothetical protein